MKKYLTITGLYILFIILYSAVLVFMKLTVSTNYFIGLLFVSCAFVMSLITLLFSDGTDSPSFPSNIALCIVSIFYLFVTIYINHTYGMAVILNDKLIDLTPTSSFVLYHIICAVVYIAIYLLVTVTNMNIRDKKYASDDERELRNSLVKTVNSLVEKVKLLPESKDVINKLEKLSDDIRFAKMSDNAIEKCEKISVLVDRLNNDISSCLEIETMDYSSIDVTVSKIYEVIIKD